MIHAVPSKKRLETSSAASLCMTANRRLCRRHNISPITLYK